jgi:toxin FitB
VSFLLDTNVLSEVRKGACASASVMAWWDDVHPGDLYFSVIVAGEIHRGIQKLMKTDPSRAREFSEWLYSVVQAFEGRILQVDLETAEIWGRLTARRTLPLVDALLAATALAHDFTLVTRNTHDIHDTGVRYVNPFEEA